MVRGRDFVFTGLQPWDLSIGSNARDIALEVSRSNRVLYVNTPLVSWSGDLKSDRPDVQRRRQVLRGDAEPLRQINENLWVVDCPFTLLPVNKLPDGWLFDMFNKKNNRKLFRFVNRIIKELGFRDIIHFIDNDIYRSFYSKEFLKPKLSIYYRRDNILSVGYWRKHAARLEPLLIAKSDLVVSNSAYLAHVAAVYNPDTSDIGQGVDLTGYTTDTAIPDDMSAIPRPVVGYVGYVTTLRLDADLIYTLAKANPSYSFVMVGSTDDGFDKHALHGLPNVFFLGFKKPESVPSYINAFDICINPQVLNDATIGNYPRKIDEYLALGKPTVATRTETMEMFRDHVYLCSSAGEYSLAFSEVLSGKGRGNAAERMRFAQAHTWEASVSALYDAINTMIDNGRK